MKEINNQVETLNEKTEVNVLPLGKGKRILLFLADFFLNFLLGWLLFTVAVLPLGKLFTSYSSRNTQYISDTTERAEVFLDNKLVFDSGNVAKSELIYNTSFTYYCYLSYFTIDEENPTNVEYKQYGHKAENDIFKHYFLEIRTQKDDFIRLFDLYNSKYSYFTRDDLTITLKDEYKSEIYAFFDIGDKVSALGEKYMDQIQDSVFLPMFGEVVDSISKNDLKNAKGSSYIELQKNIKVFEAYVNTLAIYTAFITMFISTGILYVLIPLLNRHHKTIGMMILKEEKINMHKLDIAKPGQVVVSAIYQLLMALIIAFFVPIGFLTIYEMFNISILMIFAIFGLMLVIVSFIFLMFNKFNQTLFDSLTRTVYLTTANLDEIYRAKGYYI